MATMNEPMDTESTRTIARSTRGRRLPRIRELGVLGALVLLFLFFSIASPYFFSFNNLVNVVRQVSLLGIVSMGMTMVIVTGEIDLSVGSVFGAASILTGVLINVNFPVVPSIIAGVLAGIFFGAVNGVLVTFGRIPSLIVTLGMLNTARGAALIISGGQVVNLSDRASSSPSLAVYLSVGQGSVLSIPFLCVIFIVIAVVSYLLYGGTILGFRMKAVGGSEQAAKASGINISLVKIAAFVITGFLAAIVGLLNMAFLANVQGTAGEGLELEAIAAVIIGGTSLKGGEGTILGTIIGVLIIGVLQNGIILMGVSPFWQITIVGLVMIGAVALDMWTKRAIQ